MTTLREELEKLAGAAICNSMKCGEYNTLRCARPAKHAGEHAYVVADKGPIVDTVLLRGYVAAANLALEAAARECDGVAAELVTADTSPPVLHIAYVLQRRATAIRAMRVE